jgi:electron transfer flavoprotein alpha subunit
VKNILIIAEILAGQIRPVTYELIAAARKIETFLTQAGENPHIRVIIPADNPEPLAEKLATETGIDTIGGKTAAFKTDNSDIYIDTLGPLLKSLNPALVLIAHTAQGRDFAPGLALELEAAAIAGVNGISCENDEIVYSRPVLHNSKNLLIRPEPEFPLIVTLLPGTFQRHPGKAKETGEVTIHEIAFSPTAYNKNRIRQRQTRQRSGENQALKKAKIIVAAGRGLKKPENLKYISSFARCFTAAAVGASRPLVDMGWIGYEHQVGITGAAVTPELYLACGISGSSQHLAGMKNAKFIVAINKNPQAPIFNHADICINADAVEFIEAFLKTTTKNRT